MPDTAALVVALSAQLTKFEKDMKDAAGIAERQTKIIEGSFAKMNAAIESEMTAIAKGSAGQLGSLGTVLSRIGPVGLSVAAVLGTMAVALDFINSKVELFAQKANQLREGAETLGISIEALKALGSVGQQVGLSFEQTEAATQRLALSVQSLRERGSGPLFDVLLKINPVLIRQVAAAKDVTQAIDVLSAAYKELNKEQQFQLSSAVGGRRGLAIGRVLGGLPEGGLSQAAQDQLNKGFSPELIERVAKLQTEIEAIKKQTDTIWGTAFAESNLTASKVLATAWQAIAEGIVKAAGVVPSAGGVLDRALRGAQKALEAGRGPVQPGAPAPTQGAVPDIIGPVGPAFDKAAAAADNFNRTLISDLATMRKWTSVLGDALTQAEALKQKELELAVAVRTEGVSSEQAARARAAFVLQQRQTAEAIRERLAVATQEEIVQAKLDQARADAVKIGQANLDLTKAEIIFRKQAKEQIEQQQASLSKLTETMRAGQQASDFFKNLDQVITSTASTFENTLGDIATGSKSLADAFKSMTDSIIRDLVRMTIRLSVTGPLLRSIGMFFPGSPSLSGADNPGWGAPLSAGSFLPRQGGGPVFSGTPYVVGEHGRELFVPHTSGQIIPGNLSAGGTGGTEVTVNNYVAADTETRQSSNQDSPDGPRRIVIDIVKKEMGKGGFDSVNSARFGLRPAKVR